MGVEKNAASPPILMDIPEELVGRRVVVRRYHPGDGAALWEAIAESQEHLRPWMPWLDENRSEQDAEAYVRKASARWQLREDMPVGIWERGTGRFLGGSGLHNINWTVPAFEIGYWLRATAEGQGYATETVLLLCCLAFEKLGAQRVEIRCDAANERSAAIPRRLCFTHEATLRNDCRGISGDLRDTVVYALTPEDYIQVRDMFPA